jgi:hypothetical protein
MGGKFRVKAAAGGQLQAPPVCAGTAVESTSRRVFMIPGSVPVRAKLFCLADGL